MILATIHKLEGIQLVTKFACYILIRFKVRDLQRFAVPLLLLQLMMPTIRGHYKGSEPRQKMMEIIG